MAKIKTLTFELPTHPRRGPQKIVVEQVGGIWYLVIDADKAKPLPTLKRTPTSAKQVLDALEKVAGTTGVAQYVTEGFSH